MGDRSVHCRNSNFIPFFAPVTLTLTRWPSYTNLTRIPGRYTGCANMNFLREGFRKLSSDGHTDRPIIYAWSLPVTWQRWRSHNLIRRSRNPHFHTVFAGDKRQRRKSRKQLQTDGVMDVFGADRVADGHSITGHLLTTIVCRWFHFQYHHVGWCFIHSNCWLPRNACINNSIGGSIQNLICSERSQWKESVFS